MEFEIEVFVDAERKFVPRKKIADAAERAARGESLGEGRASIILTSDGKIHELNKEFLNHDYPTDVITFELENKPLEGEIYISIDTAERQAAEYKVSLTNELKRLAVHGILHLAGYKDDSEENRSRMARMEDKYL
jgi:probable rRNA maturation factor